MANGEIIIAPFHGSGHIFPATELARRLSSRDYRVTLLLPSPQSSTPLHPLIQTVEYSMPRPPGPPPPSSSSSFASPGQPSPGDCSHFRDLLAKRLDEGDASRPPVCAVIDVMMSQLLEVCSEFGVPAVSLFTASACSAALDHAVSMLSMTDLGPGGIVTVPGLPEEMALTAVDLMHQGPPPLHFEPCDAASVEEDAAELHHSVQPPPLMPGHNGLPRPPLAPDFVPGHVLPPPFGHRHHDGPRLPWRPAPPPSQPFQPGHGIDPPPSLEQECVGRGPPPPPPFVHGHPARPPPPHGPGIPGCPPPLPFPPPGRGPVSLPHPFDRHHHAGGPPPPPFRQGEGGGPTPPGPPQGLAETEGAVALLFNTCDDLERPFLHYIAKEAKKPVWGVGPLLPSQFWSAGGSVLHEDAIRPKSGGNGDGAASVTEADVLQFLDSKPHGSVIYISFGSLVVPSDAELEELASVLEESSRPFIWALQPQAMRHDSSGRPVEGRKGQGYYPEGLAERARGRGLVIHGWAPQLLILSHPATGGFVTHCGWNSTVEALGRGVPVLAWPVHGDQIWNAKLVARKLKTGLAIKDGAGAVTKAEVADGIERLMKDEGMRKRAAALAWELFAGGFPTTSDAALNALLDFVADKHEKK